MDKIELNLKNLEENFFYDIVLGKCNIIKTLEQKNIAIEKELKELKNTKDDK